YDGGDLGAEQFDRLEDVLLRHPAEADLDQGAVQAVQLVVGQQLLDDLLRAADDETGAGGGLGVEGGPRHREPAATLVDVGHHALREVGVHRVAGALAGTPDVAVKVDAGAQRGGVVPGPPCGLSVQVDGLQVRCDRPEQQRHGHGEAEAAGADGGGGGSSDADPDRQFLLHRAGTDVGFVQCGAEPSVPGDRVLRADPQQQVELLAVQVGVVGQVVAEEGEGLGVGAAAGDDLGPASGDLVEGRELFPDPHRVVGAEHGDRAGQPDVRGGLGGRGQDDGGGRADEVGAVVLPDGEQVEPGLVGEPRLL